VLPGVLAFLIALVLAVLAGLAARWIISRTLRRIEFDGWVERWVSGLGEWWPARSPTLLVSRLVYWLVVLLGLVIGLTAISPEVSSRLLVRIVDYLPSVVVSVLVLMAGMLTARFLSRAVLINAVNFQIQSARLLSLGVKWLILVLAGSMALEHLGIGGYMVRLSFGILFGGIVLALALAVGLGSKDVVSRTWERQTKAEDQEERHFDHI
jgi:hypothetical protein